MTEPWNVAWQNPWGVISIWHAVISPPFWTWLQTRGTGVLETCRWAAGGAYCIWVTRDLESHQTARRFPGKSPAEKGKVWRAQLTTSRSDFEQTEREKNTFIYGCFFSCSCSRRRIITRDGKKKYNLKVLPVEAIPGKIQIEASFWQP